MRILKKSAVFLIAILLAGAASAQPYPHKPITLIVPFSSGGPTDTVARTIAASMEKRLRQNVVIENVAGAGGVVGTQRAARAVPDGYTLLLHHTSMAVVRAVQPQSGLDPIRDFEFIGEVSDAPMVLIGRRDLPAGNLTELLRYLKANPDKISFAHAGRGSGTYLCGLLFMDATDVGLKAAIYKGSGPAMHDLLSGKIDLMCEQATTATPHVRRGDVVAYGVTSRERVPSLPNLPTLHEQGLNGFEIEMWHALYVPKGAPKEALEKLNDALRYALADAGVSARFKKLNTELEPLETATPEYARRHLEAEIRKWVPIIENSREYAN